jgi:hypothetical protein
MEGFDPDPLLEMELPSPQPEQKELDRPESAGGSAMP